MILLSKNPNYKGIYFCLEKRKNNKSWYLRHIYITCMLNLQQNNFFSTAHEPPDHCI